MPAGQVYREKNFSKGVDIADQLVYTDKDASPRGWRHARTLPLQWRKDSRNADDDKWLLADLDYGEV